MLENPSEAGRYVLGQQPGFFVILQAMHCIDLHHRGTMLVSDVEELRIIADMAGVKYISTSGIDDSTFPISNCMSRPHLLLPFVGAITIKSPSETGGAPYIPPLFGSLRSVSSSRLIDGIRHGYECSSADAMGHYCIRGKDKHLAQPANTSPVSRGITPRPSQEDASSVSLFPSPPAILTNTPFQLAVSLTQASIQERFPQSLVDQGRRLKSRVINIQRTFAVDESQENSVDNFGKATITAQVNGSNPNPYDVRIELTTSGIVAWTCSCDQSLGSQCKHVTAVLFAYVGENSQSQRSRQGSFELSQAIQPPIDNAVSSAIPRPPRTMHVTSGSVNPQRTPSFELVASDSDDDDYGADFVAPEVIPVDSQATMRQPAIVQSSSSINRKVSQSEAKHVANLVTPVKRKLPEFMTCPPSTVPQTTKRKRTHKNIVDRSIRNMQITPEVIVITETPPEDDVQPTALASQPVNSSVNEGQQEDTQEDVSRSNHDENTPELFASYSMRSAGSGSIPSSVILFPELSEYDSSTAAPSVLSNLSTSSPPSLQPSSSIESRPTAGDEVHSHDDPSNLG